MPSFEYKKPLGFAIINASRPDWFLYTAEKTEYGFRIEWTELKDAALVFSSEDKIAVFVEKVLDNKQIGIYQFRA